MLDVMSGSNGSGLLIPRLGLGTSGITFNGGPAPHLLLMNTNSSWSGINRFSSGIGMYRNAGTKASPNWKRFLDSDDASYFWGTSGNAISGGDFLGTTNNQALLIKTGSNATYAQKVTIPTSQNGTLLIENLRAISVPNWNGSGYDGEAMFRINNHDLYGLGGNTSESFISLIFGNGKLKAKNGGAIGYGINIGNDVSAGSDPTERLDVRGSIYARDQLVYSYGNNLGVANESIDKTRKVERFWTGSLSINNQTPILYREGPPSGPGGITFRIARDAGTGYTVEASTWGNDFSGVYSQDGNFYTLPNNETIWTAVSPVFSGDHSSHVFTYNYAGLKNMFLVRVFIGGDDANGNLKVIIEAWYK